jgi:2,4-dienoyl-CoA reductase-like NADH-dependent reductase (Old Yellow Enzyme family)
MSTLFDPLKVGALTLKNRIIMAPLTRQRAGVERVPNALMAQYYADRASAGLILSEATSVTPQGVGYADTPGIWSDEQVEGWKLVTKAVHEAGGKIFLQLWHVGRISDPIFLNCVDVHFVARASDGRNVQPVPNRLAAKYIS